MSIVYLYLDMIQMYLILKRLENLHPHSVQSLHGSIRINCKIQEF